MIKMWLGKSFVFIEEAFVIVLNIEQLYQSIFSLGLLVYLFY